MSVTEEVPSGSAAGDPAGKPGGRHGSQDDQLSRGHEVPHLQSPRHGRPQHVPKWRSRFRIMGWDTRKILLHQTERF